MYCMYVCMYALKLSEYKCMLKAALIMWLITLTNKLLHVCKELNFVSQLMIKHGALLIILKSLLPSVSKS